MQIRGNNGYLRRRRGHRGRGLSGLRRHERENRGHCWRRKRGPEILRSYWGLAINEWGLEVIERS